MDKGVVSAILPDDQMPVTEYGDRVDIICDILGVPGRLNPGQLYEIEMNCGYDQLVYFIKRNNIHYDKAFEMILQFLSILSTEQLVDSLQKEYDSFVSESVKEDFVNAVMEDRSIHQPPFYDNATLDDIEEMYKTFPFIRPMDVYINKFGRNIKIMNKMIVGDKYIIRLKHDPKSKFIMRSTGIVDSKDLPTKTMAKKTNRALYAQSATRFGDMEINRLIMNNNPEAYTKLNMSYSSSTEARRSLQEVYAGDPLNPTMPIPDNARNRNIEILDVYLAQLGISKHYDPNAKERTDSDYVKLKNLKNGIDDEDDDE